MAIPKLNNNQLITQFQDFRQKIYKCFSSCKDACMDLLDALSGNTDANSIAELSLNPLFQRSYNSIYKAIKESFNTKIEDKSDDEKKEETSSKLIRAVSQLIEKPQQRPFYLFTTDTTPHPRPYAKILAERGYIYQPNTVKGNNRLILVILTHCFQFYLRKKLIITQHGQFPDQEKEYLSIQMVLMSQASKFKLQCQIHHSPGMKKFLYWSQILLLVNASSLLNSPNTAI
ncbi:MAG: hypothetical protein NHB32_04265 [Fischerella sp. CENA71]|nr:hypothetical protein [Fischerella sp. CENA71]